MIAAASIQSRSSAPATLQISAFIEKCSVRSPAAHAAC
jgi:hypothetical protein